MTKYEDLLLWANTAAQEINSERNATDACLGPRDRKTCWCSTCERYRAELKEKR